MDCATLKISLVLDHAYPSSSIMSPLPWLDVSIDLKTASFSMFRPRSNPRRPSISVPPLVMFFGRIPISASTAPFPLVTALLWNPSPVGTVSASCPPICLIISLGDSTPF